MTAASLPANLDYQSPPLRLLAGTSDLTQTDSAVGSGSDSMAASVARTLHRSQVAQAKWNNTRLKDRLKCIRNLRLAIANDPRALAGSTGRSNIAETLAAEVLPLADACKFLEAQATKILRDRTLATGGRPMWLWGNHVRLRREPLGVVLVIGPGNYPLMLPGIQAVQALVAGNSVLWKPAPGYQNAARHLAKMADAAGIPEDVLQILSEDKEAATHAMQAGVNKVVLTGSIHTGRAVSRALAETTTPAVMELSGCDAVFVLDDADVKTVASCLAFGLTLNRSQTCIAPRRVFASDAMVERITPALLEKLQAREMSAPSLPNGDFAQARAKALADELSDEAVAAGAKRIPTIEGVTLLDDVKPTMKIAQSDLFVPVLSFIRVSSMNEAIAQSKCCPYALGASVFGSTGDSQEFARNIDAGCVVINDMIAPTADPRIPFGGRGLSGFGTTRGAAGLEEMTQLKAVVTSRKWFRPHLDEPTPVDADVLESLIRLEHARSPLNQLSVVPGMIASTISQIKHRSKSRKSL